MGLLSAVFHDATRFHDVSGRSHFLLVLVIAVALLDCDLKGHYLAYSISCKSTRYGEGASLEQYHNINGRHLAVGSAPMSLRTIPFGAYTLSLTLLLSNELDSLAKNLLAVMRTFC